MIVYYKLSFLRNNRPAIKSYLGHSCKTAKHPKHIVDRCGSLVDRFFKKTTLSKKHLIMICGFVDRVDEFFLMVTHRGGGKMLIIG